ncbi:hypothetical protein CROQUDRAFT_661890, partial [Cronartium quercuum f. sp. fusiforme G11]
MTKILKSQLPLGGGPLGLPRAQGALGLPSPRCECPPTPPGEDDDSPDNEQDKIEQHHKLERRLMG